jgi:hypothetical protein
MKKQYNNSPGITETVSVILVIALVIALAIVIYILVSGAADPRYTQKTVYIAGATSAVPLNAGQDANYVLTYLAKAGDPFYLVGQRLGTGTPVSMRVFSPDGRNLTPYTGGLSGSLYGKTLYIYQDPKSANSCEYVVSDAVPATPPPPLVKGIWKMQMIDEKIHVLADTYTATVTRGTTSLPVTILTGTGTGGKSYRADCSVSFGNCTGTCPLVRNTSPCNMTYSAFTGSNSLTFPDDPTLKYTGDLTISVAIRPTTTGDSANSANWHQIIGKGVTVGVNDENDNYQFFQMGDRLYFEWNDAVTGTHYHAMTPTGVLQAGEWNYLTVVVQGGHLSIYHDGVSEPLSYYQSNVPGVNPIGAPTVRLQNNNNPVTIGKQNGSPGNEFYFTGDIGGIGLYNRALTPEEIAALTCHK